MATISRLNSNGVFLTGVPLDEISQTKVSQSQTNIFAREFDEVTINPMTNGLARRETSDGRLLIAGYFDETTIL